MLGALYDIEKLQIYLLGEGYKIYTNYMANEVLKRKIVFGSIRIRRGFIHIEIVYFYVIYWKGEKMVVSDTLIR